MKRGIGLRSSKAQAAMEFLMTYGWALLVVLVAIGALAFFGVLNPGQFLPDQCTLFSGVSCISYYASVTGPPTNSLSLTFQNGLGYKMVMDQSVAVCPTCGVDVRIPTTGSTPLVARDITAAMLNNCDIAINPSAVTTLGITDGGTLKCDYALPAGTQAGARLKGAITITWREATGTGNLRTRSGNLAVTVET